MDKTDASKKLLPKYEEKKILNADVLDGMEMETVGMLMEKSVAAARQAKDWALSDKLRDEIAAQGWLVKDSKEGQTCTKK